MSRNITILAIAWLTALGCAAGGCVEIAFILTGGSGSGADGGGSTGSLGNDLPVGGNSDGVPVARLTASNTSPSAQEEVFLACTRIAGDATGITFTFAPNDGRLFVDRRQGTASFIVSESDVSQEFVFTCTATNDVGTGGPSNSVVIIPTGGN